MKRATFSLILAVLSAAASAFTALHSHMGAAFVEGLIAIYFLVRSEVLYRSGL